MPPTDPNPETEPREPTMAELMAVMQATQKAIAEADTPAEAREDAPKAIKQEADKQGLELTEDQAKFVADTVITELENRGAFEHQPAAEGPPAPPAPEVPAEGPPAAEAPAAPPAPSADQPPEEPPRRKSLAERFQGR